VRYWLDFCQASFGLGPEEILLIMKCVLEVDASKRDLGENVILYFMETDECKWGEIEKCLEQVKIVKMQLFNENHEEDNEKKVRILKC